MIRLYSESRGVGRPFRKPGRRILQNPRAESPVSEEPSKKRHCLHPAGAGEASDYGGSVTARIVIRKTPTHQNPGFISPPRYWCDRSERTPLFDLETYPDFDVATESNDGISPLLTLQFREDSPKKGRTLSCPPSSLRSSLAQLPTLSDQQSAGLWGRPLRSVRK